MIKRCAARYVTRPRILHGLPVHTASAQAMAAVDSMWGSKCRHNLHTIIKPTHRLRADNHSVAEQVCRFCSFSGRSLKSRIGALAFLMRQQASFRLSALTVWWPLRTTDSGSTLLSDLSYFEFFVYEYEWLEHTCGIYQCKKGRNSWNLNHWFFRTGVGRE